jgi:hypothetical protein
LKGTAWEGNIVYELSNQTSHICKVTCDTEFSLTVWMRWSCALVFCDPTSLQTICLGRLFKTEWEGHWGEHGVCHLLYASCLLCLLNQYTQGLRLY